MFTSLKFPQPSTTSASTFSNILSFYTSSSHRHQPKLNKKYFKVEEKRKKLWNVITFGLLNGTAIIKLWTWFCVWELEREIAQLYRRGGELGLRAMENKFSPDFKLIFVSLHSSNEFMVCTINMFISVSGIISASAQ